MKRKTKTINKVFRFSPEEAETLRVDADKAGLSESYYIRLLLSTYEVRIVKLKKKPENI